VKRRFIHGKHNEGFQMQRIAMNAELEVMWKDNINPVRVLTFTDGS
jgi:hypothetical protein